MDERECWNCDGTGNEPEVLSETGGPVACLICDGTGEDPGDEIPDEDLGEDGDDFDAVLP